MAIGDKTAAVFGGGGFIGRHLVRRLARNGTVIRVPTRHAARVKVLRTAGVVGQIVPEMIDVFDDAELAAAIQGADLVVNLIGILYQTRKDSFVKVHEELPGRIARLSADLGVKRLVHVSALGASLDSRSVYACTKAAGEAAVRAVFPQATILRPATVFGPEDDFFNRFAAMSLMSPALPLVGGETRFQPVYVGDVADAIMASLERADAPGRTYELGGPAALTFRQLMQKLMAATGRHRLLVPVPWGVAHLLGSIGEWSPGAPPLTRDQVELLKQDNVLSGQAPGLSDLGIRATALDVILPTYLDRFRPGGRFSKESRV